MADLKKKRKIVYILTIVTLANLWASIALDVPNQYAKGMFSMITVILVGITIERWSNFNKAYMEYKINEKLESLEKNN